MSVSPQFVKNVFEAIASAFANAGWEKRKAGILSVDLSDDAYGCVGLNKALYQGGILEVNPVVSVGNHRVERLVADFSGIKHQPYLTACIGANVGYLMPEQKYRAWPFQEDINCELPVAEMTATVEKFGRPFMQQNATLEAIYNTLLNSKRGTPPDPLDYRIAAASLLLGRRTEAQSFVDAKLQEVGNRTDPAAEWFRSFAARLREYMVSRQ
jgi:hypothetical protein